MLGGVALSTAVGAVLFYVFVWQQLGEALVWSLNGATGQQLFDAARTTVTLVGIIGLGGAAFIAFRRQRTTESAQLTAAGALLLNQQEFQHEAARTLRDRYTAAAEQLGSDSFAVRLAGVYALSALADDWAAVGNPSERQISVDLLCVYLRTPIGAASQPTTPSPQKPLIAGRRSLSSTSPRMAQEREVRQAILSTIAAKTSNYPDGEGGPWSNCRFDFSGAELDDVNFSHSRFNAAVRFNQTVFNGPADFWGAILVDSQFEGATFHGVATFRSVHFNFRTSFDRARFEAGADFRRTQFKMETSFSEASFSGYLASFDSAHFHENSTTYFIATTFDPSTTVGFSKASFDGPVHLAARELSRAAKVQFNSIKSWEVPPQLELHDDPVPENFEPKAWPPPSTVKGGRVSKAEDDDAVTTPEKQPRWKQLWEETRKRLPFSK